MKKHVVFFAACGPNSRWPVIGQSKTQRVSSHSTPEFEIVACSCDLRTIGLPATLLWSTLLGEMVTKSFYKFGKTAVP